MPPNFIADENIDAGLIDFLRDNNLTIIAVYEKYRGFSDIEIIELARNKNAIILTEDKDFGEWTFAHKQDKLSIILLRYKPGEENGIKKVLIKIINKEKNNLYGKFVVITPKKIRMREI